MSRKNNGKLSVYQLTLMTALNMMGSGIIMLPTKLAEVGTISVVSWLVTATGSSAMAYVFAKCGMLSRNKGGMGGYAQYAFGKSGSFMANYTYCVSLLIATVAISIAAVGYGTTFLGVTLTPREICIATIVLMWFCTAVNFKGARITGMISSVTVWGVILPVAILSVVGWFFFSLDTYIASWNPKDIPFFDAVSSSITMTLFSFLGLESACANAEAVENPEKNVPIAVMTATLGVAAIYILSTNVIAGILSVDQLTHTNAPFGLVFATIFSEPVGKLVMALMVCSCTGSLISWQFTIANVFKASADDGYFPPIFSKVTKDNVPLAGMITIVTAQTVLALMTVNPSLYRQFNVLADLTVVTNIIPYILSMAAVLIMIKVEHVERSEAKLIRLLALAGSVYSYYALYASGMQALMYGGLVTFAGWTLYVLAAEQIYDKTHGGL